MDKAALVNVELERGAELLDVLDRAHLKVNVALWAYLSEYEDWRLVVSARQFDALGPRDAIGCFSIPWRLLDSPFGTLLPS
ncbi:MAG: hypothetical protein LAP87_07075 [Acidobacteriia bacterium]|nr:hypothetical protein [Terriglobia bacterium]